jgi:hypothetical protein
VTVALCAALLAATPTTAEAERVDDADTVGDMARMPSGRVDSERTLNDISNTKLTHGDRRVAITVDYVDLRRKAGGRSQYLGIHMLTNEGLIRHMELEAWPRHWSGTLGMYRWRWRQMDCAVRHSIDYRANVIKIGFPRRCASNPRWVRFKILTEVWSRPDNGTLWEDDGLLDRPKSRGPRLEQSERVHVQRSQRTERRVDAAPGRPVQSACRLP